MADPNLVFCRISRTLPSSLLISNYYEKTGTEWKQKGTQLRDKCEAGTGPISNHTQGLKKQLLKAKSIVDSAKSIVDSANEKLRNISVII